jgi:hypothetical protein
VAGPGEGDHAGPSGRGADELEGRLHGAGARGPAELHAGVVGEPGRQGAEQCGDEGVLDRVARSRTWRGAPESRTLRLASSTTGWLWPRASVPVLERQSRYRRPSAPSMVSPRARTGTIGRARA